MIYDRTDGVGYSLVVYFTMKQDMNWDDPQNNAAKLFRKFTHAPLDGTSRKSMKGRFKCIGQVAKRDELDGGLILGNTLRKFNGKPFLAAPMQRYYEGQDYLEVDVDVHEFTWYVFFVSSSSSWKFVFVCGDV